MFANKSNQFQEKILNFVVKNKKKILINTIMDRFSSVNWEDIQSLVNKSKNSKYHQSYKPMDEGF